MSEGIWEPDAGTDMELRKGVQKSDTRTGFKNQTHGQNPEKKESWKGG